MTLPRYEIGDMIKMKGYHDIGVIVDITYNGIYLHIQWLNCILREPQPHPVSYANKYFTKL